MSRERLTLQQMARRADVSLATVAALRAGTRGKRPHPTTLTKLARAMSVDVGELIAAVSRTRGEDRPRELVLLEIYRTLDDTGKARLEQLARELRSEQNGATVYPD
ncbi:MAG TPA: helix-turn-helix transcriptional regulator [Mycobacteriales bacterium]|nr:helix-turn-helix transcriptional regulator [Mycobacteriales bacterium]